MTGPKDQKLATVLALSGLVLPGLHKFYLGRNKWGVTYLVFWCVFWWTSIPQFVSVIEGLRYLSQNREEFDQQFNSGLLPEITTQTSAADPAKISAIAQALRQLDSLRQEGLISEYEFEQKRRQLLE